MIKLELMEPQERSCVEERGPVQAGVRVPLPLLVVVSLVTTPAIQVRYQIGEAGTRFGPRPISNATGLRLGPGSCAKHRQHKEMIEIQNTDIVHNIHSS